MIRIYRVTVNAWDWVFYKGTRTVEVVNVFLLLTWALAYGIGYSSPDKVDVYTRIGIFDGGQWWIWMCILASFQVFLMCRNSFRYRVLTGFALMISCITWLFVSFKFLSTPLIVTGVTTYAVWAFFCAGAGSRKMWINDEQLLTCKEHPKLKTSKYGKRVNDECTIDRDNGATVTTGNIRNGGRISRRNHLDQEGS